MVSKYFLPFCRFGDNLLGWWAWMSKISSVWGTSQLYLNKLSTFPSLLVGLQWCGLFLLMLSHKSHRLSSFLFILFFSFCSSYWIMANDLSLSSLILLLGPVCCWSALNNKFFIQSLYSSVAKFVSVFLCVLLHFLLVFSWFHLIVFLCCSSLSILRIIILNSLSSSSCISISLGSVTRRLLSSLCGVLFPFFYVIPTASHSHLHTGRSSHLFQT